MPLKQYLTLEDVRKKHILKVLKKNKWNIEVASSILKISEKSLKKKIRNMVDEVKLAHKKRNRRI